MRGFDQRTAWAAPSAAVPVCGQARRAATRVLEGSLPEPLLTSRARAWDDITVELFQFDTFEALVQPVDHVVAVHLAGEVSLQRERSGQPRSRAMHTGDITITPAGPPVRWSQSGVSTVALIRLAPGYVRAIARDECAMDRFELQEAFSVRDTRLEALGRHLLAALELEHTDSQLHADTLRYSLTTHLLRHYVHGGHPVYRPAPRLSPHKVRRTVDYIRHNLRGDLTLATLARVVALSPGHFAHAFREATGVTPHAYVLQARVEKAKTLLTESDLPIIEIADHIGCCSHSHFSVMFHRATGATPRQYRSRG